MTLPEKKPRSGAWIQTDLATHEKWAVLTRKSPLAAQIMHLLAARVGEHNAVVISQKTLAELAKASRRGVQNAIEVLKRDRWIEVRQIGDRGTVNAYVVNSRVAWSGARDGLRYALFSAVVIVSEDEQPDRAELGRQETLNQIPRMFEGERQLPSGEGLPPPVEPSIPGLEPELPAMHERDPSEEPKQIGTLLSRLVPKNTP